MKQTNCLNFCEIFTYVYDVYSNIEELIDNINQMAGFPSCERIYIGSYFCGQYFLHLSEPLLKELSDSCKQKNIKITLVVPIFGEKDINKGKEKIMKLTSDFQNTIDEITVNDYGMLSYIHNHYSLSINLGRLFMKDYRDPRHQIYFEGVMKPKIFTKYLSQLVKDYNITGLEFDPTHKEMDFSERIEGVTIGIHSPYCYMTVGQICEYASIQKEITKKFRPNATCGVDCKNAVIHYHIRDTNDWIRLGRTIYYDNRDYIIKGLEHIRSIFFPLDIEVKL